MKFLKADTMEEAKEKLLSAAKNWPLDAEFLPLPQANGKILSQNIYAKDDLPHFRRSSVDGYALQSKDTQGAGESIPSFLTIVGEIEMGNNTNFTIAAGQCAEIPTGGMLPDGADAVIMIEYCEPFGDKEIAVYQAVPYGSHVMQIGDDMKKDTLLLPKGKRLTPQDIGALAAAGIKDVPVFSMPKICFISTGDELISPHYSDLQAGKIRETNTLSLTALAQKHGYIVTETYVLPDDENVIRAAIEKAMEKCHIVAVSGGSSQGKKDMSAKIINDVASPGVFTHGIAVKPGKPTILGYEKSSGTVLAGLPGHPVSAMVVFELLFGWLLRELIGAKSDFLIPAKLAANVPQSPGKLTFCLCNLVFESGIYTAIPVFSKSGLIANLTAANGYFLIGKDTEGVGKGATVFVHLF